MALRLLLPALRPCGLLPKLSVLSKESKCPRLVTARKSSNMIPRSQYDDVFPKKMRLRTTLIHHWEVIPLFVVTLSSVALLCFSIIWAIKNKVDVSFTPHTRRARKNISRTMSLRRPTAHKFIMIHQEYEPWPEMQKSLNKVDAVYSSRTRAGLSRTMNLHHPTAHKIFLIEQEYPPWPEIQDPLDKMHKVEAKARKAALAICNP